MGLKLFDDDSSDKDDDKLNKIEINQEFARRYEHNKKREDLQRLEELKKKGVIDSGSGSDESSSEEDEEEVNVKLSKIKDLKFFDALIRVRNKDPILKNKEAKLFESESESEDGDSDNNKNSNNESIKKGKVKKDDKKEKKKPMYLKDVVSKHLIEEGPEFEDEEDEEDDDNVGRKRVKSYSDEQEELRKAFLEAVEEADAEEGREGGDLLSEKSKRVVEDEEEEDVGIGEKLDEYFGGDEKLDEDLMFLKDYFKKRMWVGGADDKKRVDDEEGTGLGFSEDEEEIEKQEDYEREYNFRFEENAGDRVMGHSRVVEGSVRKKTNARKTQRERKEDRMAQAEFERKEELKHLKNVKKKEMMEKLEKIRDAAGIGEDGAWLLDEDDLEEEFNPDEYDKKMKEAFDEHYYKAEDIDPEFGSDMGEDGDDLEKPNFDKEDELLGLAKGWDDIDKPSDGFLSARERILKLKAERGGNHEEADDEEDVPEDGKRKKKRKRRPSEVEKAVKDQLLEEYYKLDYEDTVGDLKTRFKYQPVNPKRYGLSADEILMMDDKELNQYISLNKLAPYREKEWKVPRIKTYQQRQRNKELQEGVSHVPKTHKKKLMSNGEKPDSVVSSAESEKPLRKELNGTSTISRRSKRKHRQAELKLSHSRLMAYGKIPTKPKSKKKSRMQDAV